jgi:hypothetical protein
MLGLQAERTSLPADITDRVMTESGNRVDLSTTCGLTGRRAG